jgi:spore maturation protein CgeB
MKPRFMLATGIAPIERTTLQEIGRMGTIRLNYLTDDPWNPSHVARWFLEALPCYDFVFSTRTSNLEDLGNRGCSRVRYLPFAYAPAVHYPSYGSKETDASSVDVAFAGGADPDRVPLLAALIRAGFRVDLYGGYWSRYPETRSASRGHADPDTIRKALGSAKVALCLVRRANRDGSAMRTFELAAMGACILAEYTDEHREILGEDADAVMYFRSRGEMVDRLRWLLAHDEERGRLGSAVLERITSGGNTYKDRLHTMLAVAERAMTS